MSLSSSGMRLLEGASEICSTGLVDPSIESSVLLGGGLEVTISKSLAIYVYSASLVYQEAYRAFSSNRTDVDSPGRYQGEGESLDKLYVDVHPHYRESVTNTKVKEL
ncbi:hypothetical protein AALP_AA5G127500 [Arabis alpina]|uniref:Uncharacterized protein n=1 Tax=Arabis alpina TaxID=50452 RepID=A0A087GWQ1_ARAAL|nr:hypothetical protein AALP_AA5G127500 [Arabis alpina]